MRWPPLVLAVFGFCLVAASGCGKTPDLRALKLVPAISGYYDDGPTATGENRLLPSATFQLKNESDLPMTYVDLLVAYWEVGADGPKEDQTISGIGKTALEPGQTSDSITVRSGIGYTSFAARADFFTNPLFKGFIIKIIARRSGGFVPIGQLPVEPRLLPAVGRDGPRP